MAEGKPRKPRTPKSTPKTAAAASPGTPPNSETPAAIRPRPQHLAFTASAARIRLSDTTLFANTRQRKTEEWQRDAWGFYESQGEIQHAIDYIANQVAKLRLFGAMVPEDPRKPPKPDDTTDAAAAAILSLRTTGGEYSAILREITVHLFVVGECYLVGYDANDIVGTATWDVRSNEELEIKDNKFMIRDYPGGPQKEYADSSIVVIHILLSHPRWGGLPLSPLRGVLTSAHEIRQIEQVIDAAAKSRNSNGVLLVPEELMFNNVAPTEENADDPMKNPFLRGLVMSMLTPIQDPGSASHIVPHIVTGPAEIIDKFRHLSLSIDVEDELIKMERALTRLAQGLPLPPEVVTGKQGLSHWTAWSVDESTVSAYVEPFAVPVIDALTREYYRPYLEASGMSEAEARERQLWYDITNLITRPNRSADADYGLEHIAISDATWRRIKGFTDEDAPSDLERLARLLLQRGSLDPLSTVTLLKILGIAPEETPVTNIQQPPTPGPPGADAPEDRSPPPMNRPKRSGPPARSAASPLIIMPTTTLDGSEVGAQLSTLDRELRIRLHAAADAALSRALERASSTIHSRLRNHARYSTILKSAPKLEIASRIGRSLIEAEGIATADLVSGAFETMGTRFRDWTVRSYNRIGRILGITIPVPEDLIAAAQQDLITRLITLASDRLYAAVDAPPVGDVQFGELDLSTQIPYGVIRGALYAAGGGVDVLPSDASPPGGIATGAYVLGALAEAGGGVDCWQWVYSSSMRSREFEAHAVLDGIRFSSFSDPVLANKGTWPPVAFHYPGDHDWCSCGIVPILNLPVQKAS